MKTAPITVYGIPNCDSVKKTRAWLTARGLDYAFHDYKKAGVPEALLRQWVAARGWAVLLNRKGTRWRQLDPATRAGVQDDATAIAVMLAEPSTIKRPVVTAGETLLVGHDEAALAAAFAG